jgi:hypothetical protein
MVRRFGFASPLIIALVIASAAQDQPDPRTEPEAAATPPIIESQQEAVKIPSTPVLRDGTPIYLTLADTIRVNEVKPGDPVRFVVASNVWYRNMLLIPQGTTILGEVVQAEPAHRASRGSHLAIAVKNARLLNEVELHLRGQAELKGGAPGGLGTATDFSLRTAEASSGLSILALPVIGGFALAKKGKTQDAPTGMPVTVFVNGDIALDSPALGSLPANANCPSASTGRVHLLRPYYALSSTIYCNGIPIAKLGKNRSLDLELPQGYYRLALSAKQVVEMFVNGGEDYYLAFTATHFSTQLTPWNPELGKRVAQSLRPVEQKDYWKKGTKCTPLPEESITPAK